MEVAKTCVDEDRRRTIDGPPFHEARRVDHVRGGSTHVEVAAGLEAQRLAPVEDLAYIRMRVGECELSAIQPADLAVVLVRAERRIGDAEPLEHALENIAVDILVTDVDDDRHAHDVLDAPDTWSNCRHERQTFFSSRSAA